MLKVVETLLTAIESQSHRAMGSPLETDFTLQLWDQEGLS